MERNFSPIEASYWLTLYPTTITAEPMKCVVLNKFSNSPFV